MSINCVARSAPLRITVKIHWLCSASVLVQKDLTYVLNVMQCSCTPRDPAAMCPRRNGPTKGMVIVFALLALQKREQEVVAPKQRQMQEARGRRQWLAQARWLEEVWRAAMGGVSEQQ